MGNTGYQQVERRHFLTLDKSTLKLPGRRDIGNADNSAVVTPAFFSNGINDDLLNSAGIHEIVTLQC